MPPINYDELVSNLKTELNVDTAITNRYGIILGSLIKEFPKGMILPYTILEMFMRRKEIADGLNLDQINSFTFESQKYNYLFTFTEEIVLISRMNINVNLAEFSPIIRDFTQKLSENYKEQELIKNFSSFNFSKEFSKIESTLIKKENISKNKYSIIKDLIKFISK